MGSKAPPRPAEATPGKTQRSERIAVLGARTDLAPRNEPAPGALPSCRRSARLVAADGGLDHRAVAIGEGSRLLRILHADDDVVAGHVWIGQHEHPSAVDEELDALGQVNRLGTV